MSYIPMSLLTMHPHSFRWPLSFRYGRDGSAGVVVRELGRGRAILFGVMLGHLYRQNAPLDENRKPTGYTPERRALIEKPAVSGAGRGRVGFSEPLTEAILVEHGSGLAVCLSDYSERHGADAVLRVETERPVGEVFSSLGGVLKWKREGNVIEISCKVPTPVDVIVLQ